MRTTFFLFLPLLLYSFSTKAQYLHTPIQIKTIIKESVIHYQLDSVEPKMDTIAFQVLANSYKTLLAPERSPIDPALHKLSNKEKKYLKKANLFFSEKKYKQAAEQYQKLKSISQIVGVKVRIAFCLQNSNYLADAIYIYNSLLKQDSSNAFLYFQLANCYSQQQDYKTAARQITLAHLFNRNNKTVLDSLNSIYQHQNWKFRALDFEPKYAIQNTGNQVNITANAAPWITYASAKAIWAYEPGYLEKMKYISSEDSRIIEEKECLFNALLAYERLEAPAKIDFPGLYTLSRALPDKRVNDFIMYEISLRQHPGIAARLSKKRLEQLVDYVYTYRVKALEISQ